MSANTLTKAVIDYINYNGGFAWRQNNNPTPIRKGAKVIGFRKGTYKGVPDVIAIKDGGFYGFEIKAGKDRLSVDQKKFRDKVGKAGGTYTVVRSISEFIEFWKAV